MDSELLLITEQSEPYEALPALALLPLAVRWCLPAPPVAFIAGAYTVVLVDARRDAASAQVLCARLATSHHTRVVAIVREDMLGTVSPEWAITDFVLAEISPAELDARLRLLSGRLPDEPKQSSPRHKLGELVVDEPTHTASLDGQALGFTLQEFALLRVLAQYPGRVFTRAELLQQVWGETSKTVRIVDVYIRRLRTKLGPKHAGLIATVRKVGYQAVEPRPFEAPQNSGAGSLGARSRGYTRRSSPR